MSAYDCEGAGHSHQTQMLLTGSKPRVVFVNEPWGAGCALYPPSFSRSLPRLLLLIMHPRLLLLPAPSLQHALDLAWTKWERVTADRKWLAKTLWALLKLRCDARFPDHQLLPALNSTLQAIREEQPPASTAVQEEPQERQAGTGGQPQ